MKSEERNGNPCRLKRLRLACGKCARLFGPRPDIEKRRRSEPCQHAGHDDRRAKAIVITRSGRALVRRVEGVSRELEGEILAGLAPLDFKYCCNDSLVLDQLGEAAVAAFSAEMKSPVMR